MCGCPPHPPVAKPYHVGSRTFSIKYSNREDRQIGITVWYPAIRPEDSTGNNPIKDAPPDLSSAPYPLILSSSKIGNFFSPHLVSYRFVVAGVNSMDSADEWGKWLIDSPVKTGFLPGSIALPFLYAPGPNCCGEV